MSFGKMAVDWEQRLDFNKLRKDRVEKANKKLHEYGIGSAMIFQFESKRYLSSWWWGPYTRHRPGQYALFIRDKGFPYITPPRGSMSGGGFPEMVPAHEEMAPWLKDRFTQLPQPGICEYALEKEKETNWEEVAIVLKRMLKEHRVVDLPISVDYGTILLWRALEKEGLNVVDGNNWMLEARMIKTPEEIELLRMAATCNEAGYTELARVLRPGMTENQARGIMIKAAHDAGAEYEEGWVTASGPRSSPRRHNWSDRTIRAGELFAIEMCHTTFCGYKNCMSRTFMVGAKPNEMQKELYEHLVFLEDKGLKMLKPGASTHVLAKGAARTYFESVEELKKYRLTLENHRGGMGMVHSELPYISIAEPDRKLEPGMVIAYAIGGYVRKKDTEPNELWNHAGAHVENTIVVTETGNEVLTSWPWRELMIVGYPGQLYGEIKDQLNVTVE